MKVIYKYTLRVIQSTQTLMVPIHSEIRFVEEQNNIICIWMEVDLDETISVPFRFKVLATGEEFSVNEVEEYVGSVKLFNGAEIYHIYEAM